MLAWHVGQDLVAFGELRLGVQRIAASHWSATPTLRSWGGAPLHREGDALYVPCADGEALWIGAWLEDAARLATVQMSDLALGLSATIGVPHDYQLSALGGRGTPEPLIRPAGQERRTLRLELKCGRDRATIDISLLTPHAWTARCGRKAPELPDGPPPLPPRLG
ncbi:MAG TPA: hypothetical protein VLJ58_11315 [Ramlibacter sp.]|nr:hypothetical protein [Ramlibacter sp.]